MQKYEQDELDRLVDCEKTITDPPRREMLEERGSKKNGMGLESTDGRYKFRVFMRINVDFRKTFLSAWTYWLKTGLDCRS
jgi:hypothetical protein